MRLRRVSILVMTRGKMLRAIDNDRIREAIREAEKRTSGQIRVSVASLFWGDVRKTAERAFARMRMTATKERNAVLFFVVPARRKFVVLGDSGIHAKVRQEFWHDIARILSEKFRGGDFADGLVRGIAAAGEQLATHFPFNNDQKEINMTTQSTTTHIDPVCGMQVDPSRAAGSSEHSGTTYHFCSSGCKTKFDKNPKEFTGSERPKSSGGCGCG